MVDRARVWPICAGGKWSTPPEHYGDGWSYMTDRRRIHHLMEFMEQLAELLDEPPQDAAWFRERAKRITAWGRWMHFDRPRLNTRLCTANLAWDVDPDDVFSVATGD